MHIWGDLSTDSGPQGIYITVALLNLTSYFLQNLVGCHEQKKNVQHKHPQMHYCDEHIGNHVIVPGKNGREEGLRFKTPNSPALHQTLVVSQQFPYF
jgi:hypothetical protein